VTYGLWGAYQSVKYRYAGNGGTTYGSLLNNRGYIKDIATWGHSSGKWVAVSTKGYYITTSLAHGAGDMISGNVAIWTNTYSDPIWGVGVEGNANRIVLPINQDPLGVVVGAQGRIAVTEDYGLTWENVSTGFSSGEDIVDCAYNEVNGKFLAISEFAIAISNNGRN